MAYVPQDLLDRINALEREVRELRGRAQIRPALNQILNGDVVIGEGGRLLVKDPDGDTIFETGQAETGDWFVTMRRDNGVPAIGVGASTYVGDDAVNQMVRIFSRTGDVILMDDYYADGYLGRPSMPIPMQPTASATTTGTSLGVAWVGITRVMNAVLYASIETHTPAGVTADVELRANGVVLDSWVASGSDTWTQRTVTQPVRQAFMEQVTYQIRHRVRSGSGSIRTNCMGLYTRNTFTPEEAP
ncbi:hypothetical protein OG923_24330 [Streptomyces halstedii]|uniref:hypothetical protein n=1 Tax=Streptomyces halstedii TaxID=1944 RepID=UPI003253DB32